MGLKKYIIERSKEIGIDAIGFTDCNRLNNLKGYLIERRKNNKETEFEERDIEKRIDPKKVFPSCKSIITIGVSYNVEINDKVEYKFKGKISKSSWGEDYHRVIKERMGKLTNEIKKELDFKYEYFVDTGPLIDRELAKKSGVGWYGKNCSIINNFYGSFIFIGYILTDLDIEPDIEVEEGCNDCNLCIKACPTGALEEPYRLNPKKCISYLTQTKNEIPYELREKMGIKIYGCDICQLVCPVNKGAIKSDKNEFIPKITKGYIDIEELFTLSNRQFKEKYGHMSGSWRGRNILRRNSLIVLGNMKEKRNIYFLKKLLNDENPMIRKYTAWAILNIDTNMGIPIIRKTIESEKSEDVKKEIESLLKYFQNKNC